MALLRRLAALGAAAEAARRYAQKNPDKVRELADKAATFADQQTKGRYTRQISNAKQTVTGLAGIPDGPIIYPASQQRPTPYKRS